ncbi:GSCFA domain-containing protein [Flagellimonas sp.]|uniref:GSCFA domain-containing protein n=1 Tax=Flagellimonas sp. TaxID=2058762 RepID=UPI003F49DE20
MKLQTIIPLRKNHNLLDYESQSLLLGSCFSESIGDKLDYFKFNILQNPFGILFHSLAIENLLERAISQKPYTKQEVFKLGDVWSCFDAHSQMNALSRETLLNSLNQSLESTASYVKKASHIFITLGTAWTYQHKSKSNPVANCHKAPQKEFEKKLLSVEEIMGSLKNIVTLVKSINQDIQIVFTISPVRHLKDGFVENQQSKAHLIAAAHGFLASEEGPGCQYFPSYEIVMDELRDYRFYGKDMVHPNELAIDYIWQKFKSAWISEKVYDFMDEVESIQRGLSHKPFNADSKAHGKFQKNLQSKIEYLQKKYPSINFNK